jgi:hypothetical protein
MTDQNATGSCVRPVKEAWQDDRANSSRIRFQNCKDGWNGIRSYVLKSWSVGETLEISFKTSEVKYDTHSKKIYKKILKVLNKIRNIPPSI